MGGGGGGGVRKRQGYGTPCPVFSCGEGFTLRGTSKRKGELGRAYDQNKIGGPISGAGGSYNRDFNVFEDRSALYLCFV